MDIETITDYITANDTSGLNSKLNSLITIYPKSVPVPVEHAYVSYDSDRVLTVKPISGLAFGETYTIVVSSAFRAVNGRAMPQDYTWSFSVDDSSLTHVVLLSPPDNTVYASVPALTWTPVSSADSYTLQISETLSFANADITYTSNVPGSAVSNIAVNLFADKQTYYWRVCALTTDRKAGPWSETRSFRIDATPDASPEYRVRDVFSSFSIMEYFPENGAMLTVGTAVSPVITFNRGVSAASLVGRVSVTAKHVDGDVVVASTSSAATGTVVDNILILDTITVAQNTKYVVSISAGAAGDDGKFIPKGVSFSFTGAYLPMYSSADALRSAYGKFLTRYTDAEIDHQIHRASIKCNRLASIERTVTVTALLVQNAITYEAQRYAELTAAFALLQNYRYELLEESDRRTQIDTYMASTGYNILQELGDILKEIDEELKDKEPDVIAGGAPIPAIGVRSSQWDASELYSDTSTTYLQRGKF